MTPNEELENRLFREHDQLCSHMAKLDALIASPEFLDLPYAEKILITFQKAAMLQYWSVLELRLDRLEPLGDPNEPDDTADEPEGD